MLQCFGQPLAVNVRPFDRAQASGHADLQLVGRGAGLDLFNRRLQLGLAFSGHVHERRLLLFAHVIQATRQLAHRLLAGP